MDEYTYKQIEDTITEYYDALTSCYGAMSDLVLTRPTITSEDQQIMNIIKTDHDLEKIATEKEYPELKKFKKLAIVTNNTYSTIDRIILTNKEFINFLNRNRDDVSESILNQLSKEQRCTKYLEEYETLGDTIEYMTRLNSLFEKLNTTLYANIDNEQISYLNKKQKENNTMILDIKKRTESIIYKNKSLDDFIKVKDDYIKILNDSKREMNLLTTAMNDETK